MDLFILSCGGDVVVVVFCLVMWCVCVVILGSCDCYR